MSIQVYQMPVQVRGNLYQDKINNQLATKERAHVAFTAQVNAETSRINKKVNDHEDAHQSVAGSYGGGKVINFGSDELGNPRAVGGHVPIQMPAIVNAKMDLSKIDKAESHATTVASAAIAPADDLSAADRAVYAQAMKAASLARTARFQKLSFEGQSKPKEDNQQDKNNNTNAGLFATTKNQQEAKNIGRKPLNLLA